MGKRVLVAGPVPDDAFRSVGAVVDAMVACTGVEDVIVSLSPEDLSRCYAMVIPGGLPDVDPASYGCENQGSRGVDTDLDRRQLAMLEAALRQGMPVLGICRGAQLINVWFGGTLVQDLPRAEAHTYASEGKFHDTLCRPGSVLHQLYGDRAAVNTLHHQGFCRIGKELDVTQIWLRDGLAESWDWNAALPTVWGGDVVAEGFQHRSLPVWGVQWHPELLTEVGDYTNPRPFLEAFCALHPVPNSR